MNNSDHSNHTQDKPLAAAQFIDSGMLRFVTLASCLFAAFMAVYEYYLLGSPVFFRYLELAASSAYWLITTVSSLNVELLPITKDQLLTKISLANARNTYVVVTSGCDASIVFAVLISTVGAWPSPPFKRIAAVVLGLLLMYCLNILRIAGMFVVELYAEQHFDLFHEWILPSLLVIGPLVYFYFWTLISGQHPSDNV